jgi:N-acetylglucosaminyldiphosphoundecaprenol N-acetyl-beta-D-mannosaminyltransferase
LQIVGRYAGYYSKNVEGDVIAAIRKASPSVVLLSDGIPEKKNWYYRRRANFSTSTFVYYREAVGVFSKTTKRISNKIFDKGLEVWVEILHNPLKIFLIFPYMRYLILLVWYRLNRR